MSADIYALVTQPHDKYCIKLHNLRLPEASQCSSTEQPLPLDSIRFLCHDPYQDKAVIPFLFFISPFSQHHKSFLLVFLLLFYKPLILPDLNPLLFYCFQLLFDVGFLMPALAWSRWFHIGMKCRMIYAVTKKTLNCETAFLQLL